jgi:hypothetical protein
MSGLGHYMKAIHDAITSHPTISQLLEKCNCERHKAYSRILALSQGDEATSADEVNEEESNPCNEEELPLMWEQSLNWHLVNFINSTCCKKIKYTDFCVEVGDKPPKMIN